MPLNLVPTFTANLYILASLFLFPRTPVPTVLLATPLSTSLPPARLSVLSRNSPARRFLSARSLFSSLASLSLLVRRPRLPTVRVLMAPAVVLPVAAVAVADVAVVVAAAVVAL